MKLLSFGAGINVSVKDKWDRVKRNRRGTFDLWLSARF
jgi:hypothetical protein